MKNLILTTILFRYLGSLSNTFLKKYSPILGMILLLIIPYFGFAQQVIDLYEGLAPNSLADAPQKDSLVPRNDIGSMVVQVGKPTLTMYLPAKEKANGAAIIICPGGGYSILAIEHEGYQIAEKMQEKGYAAFVLKYRLPKADFVKNKEIVPLQDAQRAIQLVRENASQWNIHPNKIGIMGSSAGGHLASTAATHFDKAYIHNPKGTSLRPDFLALNYPVISFTNEVGHLGSRLNLIGPVLKDKDWDAYKVEGKVDLSLIPVPQEGIAEFSNELKVTQNTPPTFIQHALDDHGVQIDNSILFLAALQKYGIRTGAFFYAQGGHGYGLDNKTSDTDWFEPFVSWLEDILK